MQGVYLHLPAVLVSFLSVLQDAIKWYYLHMAIKQNELKVGASEKCSAQLPSHRNDWE